LIIIKKSENKYLIKDSLKKMSQNILKDRLKRYGRFGWGKGDWLKKSLECWEIFRQMERNRWLEICICDMKPKERRKMVC